MNAVLQKKRNSLELVYSKLSKGNQKSVISESESAVRRNRSAEEKFLRAKMAGCGPEIPEKATNSIHHRVRREPQRD
jgi:hypothetical protein